MMIVKYGDIKGQFHFNCKCGCEWYAKREEVSFSPPFMEYYVYMKCPCCKKENLYIEKENDEKQNN